MTIDNNILIRSYGVMVSTLDSVSSDPSSNLGRTYIFKMIVEKALKLSLIN